MAQQSFPHVPVLASEPHESAEGEHAARPSGELRIELSRFSRLLARFGLGELTDPILRPIKGSAKRGHG
jgi:hypothetical protein